MKFFVVLAALVAVAVARPTATQWTVPMLDQALSDPYLNPEIKPILIQALNEIMANIYDGAENQQYVDVTLPSDVPLYLPHIHPETAVPAPVLPEPVAPGPVEKPTFSGPLVELIININNEEASPVSRPEPESVDAGLERPEPESVGVDTGLERPEPESVGDINPIDVIAVNPPPYNPIDVIAVNPPPFNPSVVGPM